ncbi:MFS transporter [Streptomyces scopuliridis]|uniref:MFS transporter n=1 Tax=Streptomyces scopuliridis TaxID=452529 RepID=A0ACD4ZNQ6_9ACTN|nr:MFS transporter [Streptomyces scopuliridis]WSB35610.1 MFS transporter [Streptomyces scopuliridis]WSB99823.1 MFS transporter [Streptomyces scopuliridis]WSC06478.1 MFS transporter [Streptomyces scopuliridis]
MPHSPAPDTPLLAVTGDSLVLARRYDARFDPAPPSAPEPSEPPKAPRPPRTARRRGNPYARLFAIPGARAFTAGNLLARLPMGMFSVSAVIMIAGSRGSYALAGAVTATGLAATAVVAPRTARLVDRYGQARIAVPATAIAALASLALVLCVRYEAPDWTLFAAYAATATTPNTGGMSRARWAHLHREATPENAAALHTANSFEQAADELCFMLGPVLAAFLCTAFFPEAGTLTGAVLLLTGVLIFAAQRSTEPPATGRTDAARAPLHSPALAALLAVFLATGAVFGATEVVTLAFADDRGHQAWAGAVLALQAAGSCAAGLLLGALRPAGRLGRRMVLCVAAMSALLALPLLAATAGASGSLPLLACGLLIAGAATAPTMVTGMTLVQRLTPTGRLNEGMTLAVTALLAGIAAGAAAGGWTVEHTDPARGYALPLCAALLALLFAVTGARRFGHDKGPAA